MSRHTALAHAALAALGLVSLQGCPSTITCPPGARYEGGACVGGALDGGLGDAGARDGGASDGGAGDGGPPDAPLPDAGPCGGACVAGSGTPYCDEARDTCVACLVREHCSGGDSPACVGGTCVDCEANTDCPLPTASACDTSANTCRTCAADGSCAHLDGTTRCDVPAARCVACLDNTDCPGITTGCDFTSRACRPYTARSAQKCAPCVRDDECAVGLLCVPMTFTDPIVMGSTPVPVGAYCLPQQLLASGMSCAAPYSIPVAATSVDGATASTCTLPAGVTCEGWSDFLNGVSCTTEDGVDDPACGVPGLRDGRCVRSMTSSALRCTTNCVAGEPVCSAVGRTCGMPGPGLSLECQ